jgi:hypothetical protein
MEVIRVGPFVEYLDRVHQRTRRIVDAVREEDLEWQAGSRPADAGRVDPASRRYRAVHVRGKRARPTGALSRDTVLTLPTAWSRQRHTTIGSTPNHANCSSHCPMRDSRRNARRPAGAPITVGKWLRAMIEHEAHHRGQLYFILGLRGVPTPPIYGLTSEEVRARSVSSTPIESSIR